MKKLIFSCFLLLAGASYVLAQSAPLTISNNTNCAYVVVLYNEQDDCNDQCAVKVCVPPGPGASVTVNPCNPDWFWDRAIVYPSIDSCDPCGRPLAVAAPNPTNCFGLPNSVSSPGHCAGCGPYTINFSSPTTLDIF